MRHWLGLLALLILLSIQAHPALAVTGGMDHHGASTALEVLHGTGHGAQSHGTSGEALSVSHCTIDLPRSECCSRPVAVAGHPILVRAIPGAGIRACPPQRPPIALL